MRTISFFQTAHLRPVDFSRLASDDLPERKAHELRRHLSDCAQCQAEWQSVQTVWLAARDEPTRALAAPPDALRERIFALLPTSPARPERKPAMLSFLFDRPVAFASLAAATTVCVGVGALTYGPALVFHAPRAVAFEEVEAAMGGIKTATWTETSTRAITKAPKRRVLSNKGTAYWARLDPPALVYKSTVDGHRPESHRFLTTERGTLSYTPGKKEYFLFNGPSVRQEGAARLRRRIVETLLFPQTTSGQNAVQTPGEPDDAPFKWRNTPWKSESVTLNGRPALRFSRHSVRFRDDDPWWKKQVKQEYNLTLFADPQTFRIVRREWEQTAGIGWRGRTVSEQFRYNETPPEGLLDVTPPPVGKPILITDWSATGIKSKVPDAQKKEATAIVYRIAEARNKNDWKTFAGLRDFTYEPMEHALYDEDRTMTAGEKEREARDSRRSETTFRAEIERNFKAGTPYSKWRVDKVTGSGYGFSYVYTRQNDREVFPPVTPPTSFVSYALITPTTKDGKLAPQQSAQFTFVQTNAGLRVASIQFEGSPRPPVRIKGGLSVQEASMRAVFGDDSIVRPKTKTRKTKR